MAHGTNVGIDDFRIIKGCAVWTTNFTPPTSPHDATLPSGCSGSSTSVIHLPFNSDSSQSGTANIAVTDSGTISYSTSGEFGNCAAPATGAQITIDSTTTTCADNALCFDGEFTIDFWYKNNGGTGYKIGNVGGSTLFEIEMGIGWLGNTSIGFWEHPWFTTGAAFSGITGGNVNILDGSFHHIAITRDSNDDIRVFVDGGILTIAAYGNGGAAGQTSFTAGNTWDFSNTTGFTLFTDGIRHIEGITDPTAQNSAGNIGYNNLYPRFATASNGDVYTVWQQCSAGDPCDKNSIFVRKYDAAGQTWGTAVEVSTTALGSTNGERPDIAIDSNDLAHLVWTDNGTIGSRSSTYDIIYCTWNGVNSAGLGTVSTVSADLDVSLEVYESKIVVLSNVPYVIYRGDGSIRTYEIYLSYIDSSVWSAASQVSDNTLDTTTDSGSAQAPAIAGDSSNNLHIAWYNNDSSYTKIHYKKYFTSNNTYSPLSAISVCGVAATSADITPDIAVTDACKVYISWVGFKDCTDTSLGFSIYYTTIGANENNEITSSTDFDGKSALQPQIITRPGNIGTEFASKDASFAVVWYTDSAFDNSGIDNDILIQRFNDCGVVVGDIDVLSVGEIMVGFNTNTFIGNNDSSNPAITTSASEIFIGWQEKLTGSNQVYNIVGARVSWGTDGTTDSCSNTYEDYCTECINDIQDSQACGFNDRGTQTRTCANGVWPVWGSCIDPDVCVDNATGNQACGLNDRGAQSRSCTAGQWGVWGSCTDPDECVDSATEDRACGLNNRGTEARTCAVGSWSAWGSCVDPDSCVDGAQETQSCGLNNRGTQTRTCVDGQFPDWSTVTCVDPDECVDNATDQQACGLNYEGVQDRTCTTGSWGSWSTCTGINECVSGSERDIVCSGTGLQHQVCTAGQWANFGICEIYGCTDPTATNYDSAANTDDGSCTYTQSQATDIDHLLPPTYGSFGTIFIDKPLGAERSVCFDEKTTRIEVVPQTVFGQVGGSGTSVIYDMAGNMTNRNNSLVYATPVSGESGIYPPIDQTNSPPVWQTGPCLTSCTDEVPIGYGDYYFNVEPYDNNTFDIEYCLTKGEVDTFVLAVITTDFKTSVVDVDKEFGDAIEQGWDIKFRALVPGYSVIYGHGSTPIDPTGLSTLIRVYLDNSIIEQNADNITDAIVVFPVFMKLGNVLYQAFDKYVSEIDTVPYMNLIDPEKSVSSLAGDFYPTAEYINESSIMPYTYTTTASTTTTKTWQFGSSLVEDMQSFSYIMDPRFKEIMHYISDSFEKVIEDYPNDSEYITVRDNAINALHYFKSSLITWASLIKSFSISEGDFDFTWDLWHGAIRSNLCNENLTVKLFCIDSDNNNVNDRIEISIYYTMPLMSASGIEIDFSSFGTWLSANANANVIETDSWHGQLREKNFLQAYSKTTSKFAAVYGAKVSSGATSADNPYLTEVNSQGQSLLTNIVLDMSHADFSAMMGTGIPACEHNVTGTGSSQIDTGGIDAGNVGSAGAAWQALFDAIQKDLLTAQIVTNQNLLTAPSSSEWTGNAYSVGTGDVIDVKDYLTILMLSVEPASTDLTDSHIEETIKLPKSAIVEGTTTYKTVQDYYNLSTLDLSGISYDNDWKDTVTGEHILSTIDANNDGVINIYDVVAIRNLWIAFDQYPLDVETRKLNVIPNNLCAPFDINIDLLMPDQCSNFRVKPKCFSKVWFSDVISIKDENNPVKYLLEVSYSMDALDANSNPIEDFSGIQFKVDGLTGDGIIGTENGSGTTAGVDATSVKALQWSENIIPSTADSFTKDAYFAFSTNKKYIPKGKGVLCYLSINPESLPDSLEWMNVDSVQDFIVTNKFKRFKTVEGVRISHPLANLKFKSHHTDELLIYESIGLKISDFKITTNRSYNTGTSTYSDIVTAAASGWTGDTNNDSLVNIIDLNYVLGLAARSEYDVKFDSTGSSAIDIADIQAVNHYINSEIFDFGANIVPAYCCLCTDPEIPAVTVIDFTSASKEISVVGQRNTREITLSGSEFGCHSNMKHTGGVGVYWNPVDGADYYIVYRKSDDEPAVAIIGAAPGVREHSTDFDLLTSGGPKTPVQVLPTLWVDYPPVLTEVCEDYVTGDEVSTCTLPLCDIHLSDAYCVDLTCPDNYSLLAHFNDDAIETGTIIDSSKYNIQCTAHNGAALDSTTLKFGTSSCSFDGVDAYVSVDATNAVLELNAAFTIDFWAKFADTSGAEVPLANTITLFSSFDPTDTTAGGDQGIALESVDGQGKYYIRSKEGNTYNNIYIPQTAVSTLNITDWFHFAVIRDTSNNINLYVNGVKGTTAVANTYTFNHGQYGVIYVGKSLASGNFFEGNIDELRIVKGAALWTDDFSTVSGTSDVPSRETICNCEVASESDIVIPEGVITAQVLTTTITDPNVHVAEEFEYWVVAINKCNEIQSNIDTGAVINCKFGPTTTDFSFEVEMNGQYDGEFKASYHFSSRPLGDCIEATGDCIPLWTYVQNSNTGNGKKGISNKGGLIKTASRMPSSTSLAGKDEIGFTYQAKRDFVGKDTFKYTATILDPAMKQKPSSWCKSESTVTVYVKPDAPALTGDSGDCTTTDEGKIILGWDAVEGAEDYKVYKDGTLVTTISSTTSNATYTYEEAVSEWVTWVGDADGDGTGGCANDTTFTANYSVSAFYTSDGTVIESAATPVSIEMPCCLNLQSPVISIDFVQEVVNTLPDNAEACPPSNYALLLHFDEDSSGGNPVDSSTNTLSCTYNGAAALSEQSPTHFPTTSSCYFDGNGDYVTVADNSALDLAGDFTIDFWLKLDDITLDACFFSSMDLIAATTAGFELRYFGSTNLWFFSQNSGDGTGSAYGCGTWNFTPIDDTWYHVALVRNYNTGSTLYVNGARISHQPYCYGDIKFAYDHNNNGIDIGRSRQSSSTFLKGYIDEFRIVDGDLMWASDFSEAFAITPPTLYCPEEEADPSTPAIGIRKATITWTDLAFVDTYKLYRRGPYITNTTPPEWELIVTVTEDPIAGAYSYIDLVDECFGCGTVLYDYHVTSFDETSGESSIAQNTQQIIVQCTVVQPIAHDRIYITSHDTNIKGGILFTSVPYSNIVSYTLISTPDVGTGQLYNIDNIATSGLWDFNPDPGFAGGTSFEWQVLDSCGNTDNGVITIIVDLKSTNSFIILDKNELASQQDVEGVRKAIAGLENVPGQIGNINSVSALRRRDNAYKLTKSGIDDIIFEQLPHGCVDSTMFNYDPLAEIDDGTCIPYAYGCIDINYVEYDSDANTACVTPICVFPDSYALLLHFNDSGSGNIVDSSTHNISVSATGAALDTAMIKFGNSSVLFDGVDDSVNVIAIAGQSEPNPVLTLDGDFTIDFWAHSHNMLSVQTFFSSHDPTSGADGLQGLELERFNVGAGEVYFYLRTEGAQGTINHLLTVPIALNTTDWFHYALVRYNNEINLYINGVSSIFGVTSSAIFNHGSTGIIYIGKSPSFGNYFEGHIDEFRIVKGDALWKADFSDNVPDVEATSDGCAWEGCGPCLTLKGCTELGMDNYDPNAVVDDGSCYKEGCTSSWADNYDTQATINDGTCYKNGCIFDWADNFDSQATIDNGTCTLAACTEIWADNFDSNATSNDGSCYKHGCTGNWADNYDTQATIDDDSCYKFGCINNWADNFDSDATIDDGSCYLYGCTYSWADNYDPNATINDGTCVLADCTETWAENFNPNATSNDGSCYKHGCVETWADNFDAQATIALDTCYKYGCMETWADNFDPEATIENNTCQKSGCTSDWADNFDISATVDDGSCTLLGCTQIWADNFDSNATDDDGSCYKSGCTSDWADNYDSNVTVDDGSCFRCGCMETWADNFDELATIGQGDGGSGGECYFQGLFHFNGADQETIPVGAESVLEQGGWINNGTDSTARWANGWGIAELDSAYKASGSTSFKSSLGSAILHGSSALLDWSDAFTIDLRFVTAAGVNHSGVQAFLIGNDNIEAGISFYVHFEQMNSTRQVIKVVTSLANGTITFDTDSSTFTGNMLSMPILDGSYPPNLSTWQHLAVTRDNSGTMRLFIDGIQYGATTGVSGTIQNSTNGLDIGGHEQAAYATWWIDELRIHNGLDHSYLDDNNIRKFTIPATAYTEAGVCYKYGCTQSWADNFDPLATRTSGETRLTNDGTSDVTVYLVDGTSNQNDSTPNLTGVFPVITAVEKKFGVGSAYFGEDAGYISLSNSDGYVFGTNPFTIDLWVRFDDVTRSEDTVFGSSGHWHDSGTRSFRLQRVGQQFWFHAYYSPGWSYPSQTILTSNTVTLVNDTWYHLAATREGHVANVFLDGVLIGTKSDWKRWNGTWDFNAHSGITLGASIFQWSGGNWVAQSAGDFEGYIDEVRISNGENKYSLGDFDVETEEWCEGASESECVEIPDGNAITSTIGNSYKWHGFMFDISNDSSYAMTIDGTFSILGDSNAAGYTWTGGIRVYYIAASNTTTFDTSIDISTGTLGNWTLLGTDTSVVSQGDWNSGVFTDIDVGASFLLPAGKRAALYITALGLEDIGGYRCDGSTSSGCPTVGSSYATDGNLTMYSGVSHSYNSTDFYPDPGGPSEARLFRGSVGYQVDCIDQCYSVEYILHFNDLPCYLNDCMQDWADNYDANATIDDGSCTKTGCTETWADNYDFAATVDDNSCYLNGCMDPNADNYDANATVDDGSCYRIGCTSSGSDGYDPLATSYTITGPINSGIADITTTWESGSIVGSHNPQVISTNSKFGNGSAAFDGLGGYVLLENSARLYIKDGEAFTIDFWARFSGSSTSTGALLGTPNEDGPTKSFRITFDLADATPHFTVAWTQIINDGFFGPSNEYYYTYDIPLGTTIDSTTWYHIALSRDETTNALHFFLGGTEITKSGPWTSIDFTANEDGEITSYGYSWESRFDTRDTNSFTDVYYGWSIGYDHASTIQFIGEIDEFRFANKENLYSTGNFTPATTEAIPDSSSCPDNWMVWHFNDGSEGFTGPFTDSGPNGLDASGYGVHTTEGDYNPRVVRPHFGGKAIRFDGVDDWLSVPHGGTAEDVNNPTYLDGDFTFDTWIYFDEIPTGVGCYSTGDYNTNGCYPIIASKSSTTQTIGLGYRGPNIPGGESFRLYHPYTGSPYYWDITGFTPLQAKTWTHIAWTRSGSTMYFFVDGVLAETLPNTGVGTEHFFGAGFYLGFGVIDYMYSSIGYYLKGYMDDTRLIKGNCLWTESFNFHGLNGVANGEIVCSKTADVVLHFNKVTCYDYGCTQSWADNYDATATLDDGCVLSACTNSDSDNFDANATSDDGSCYRNGCTDSTKFNYDALATVDDGSCIDIIYGCLDSDYEEWAVGYITTTESALLPFNNEYGAGLIDVTGNHIVTAPGPYNDAPTFDATNKKFGSHSLRLDSSDFTGDFVAIQYSDQLKWDGAYTIDFWFKFVPGWIGSTEFMTFVGQEVFNDGIRFQIGYYGNIYPSWAAVRRYFYVLMPNAAGTGLIYSNYSHPLSDSELEGSFHHLALVETDRTSSTGLKLYLNGVLLIVYQNGFTVERGIINPHESDLLIGRAGGVQAEINVHTLGTPSDFNGWIDAFRVTKGVALWTGNFDSSLLTGPTIDTAISANTECVNGTEGGGCDPCATYYGCTDSTQDNYNAEATVDDGSCYKVGCTEPTADNYDANATIDSTSVMTNSGDSETAITFNNDIGGNNPLMISTNPKFGSGSLHFDGTGGYISVTEVDLDNEFTIDFWVKLDSLPSHSFEASRTPEEHIYYNKGLLSTTSSSVYKLFVYFADLASYGNTAQLRLLVSPLKVQDYADTSAGHYIIGDVSSSLDTTNWFHIALTRDTSDTFRLFFNGASMGTSTTTTENYSNSDGIIIGSYSDTDSAKTLDGQIDEFRYIPVWNKYPTDGSGLTIETTEYSSEDSIDGGCTNNTAVYHFNTDLSDSGPNANTATSYVYTTDGITGEVSINTDTGIGDPNEGREAFGSSSLRIVPSLNVPGGSAYGFQPSYLNITSNSKITHIDAYELYTIDFWIRFDDVTAAAPWTYGGQVNFQGLVSMGGATFDLRYYPVGRNTSTGLYTEGPTFRVYFKEFYVPSSITMENDTWYHLAITRSSTQDALYLNGTRLGTTINYLSHSSTGDIKIGNGYYTVSGAFSGYIDEVRIVKGKALWTGGSFEVPTSQYSCADSYPVLLHLNNAVACVKYGCTKFWADNYDATATIDDGSCTLNGCTEAWAENFNPIATTDDSSCVYETGICADGVVWHFNSPEAEGTSVGTSTIINSGTSELVITAETISAPSYSQSGWYTTGANFQLNRAEVGPFGNTYPLGAAHTHGAYDDSGHDDNIGYISIQDKADLYLSGKFTIDFWYKPYTLSGTRANDFASIFGSGGVQWDSTAYPSGLSQCGLWIGLDEASDVARWKVQIGTGVNCSAGSYDSGSYTTKYVADHGLTEDTWSHIALIRVSNDDMLFFVDGVLKGGPWPYSTLFDSGGLGWSIGRFFQYAVGLNGSIKEVRMLNGSDSDWTPSGFTPPTRPYGAPYSNNDDIGQVLLHFDAEDIKTIALEDTSGNPDLSLDIPLVALSGTMNKETFPVISKVNHATGDTMEDFGSSSVYFSERQPSGDLQPKSRINIPDNSAINIGTDDFTIDFWVRLYGEDVPVILRFDNNLTDSSVSGAHTATTPGLYNSGPTFDATEKQIGTHSLKFDRTNGNGDFIVIPYSDELTFDGGFTIDFWFRFTDAVIDGVSSTMLYPDGQPEELDDWYTTGGIEISYLGYNWPASDSGGRRTFSVRCPIIASGTIDYFNTKYDHNLTDEELKNSFHHLVFTRLKKYGTYYASTTDGEDGMKFYIDGVEMTSTHGNSYWSPTGYPSGQAATTINERKYGYSIGRKMTSSLSYNTQLDDDDFEGWIDELRIYNYAELRWWNQNFTPPTVPHKLKIVQSQHHVIKSLTSRQTGDNASSDDYGTLQITLKDRYTYITVGGNRNPNNDSFWEPSNVPTINADTWYHVALTRTGDLNGSSDGYGYQQLKFYIDGTLIDTETLDDNNTEWLTTGPPLNRVGTVDAGLSLGWTQNKYYTWEGVSTAYYNMMHPATGFKGYIDELRIVKGTALTSFAATAEYSCNEPLTDTCPSDWSLYHFDDNTTTDGDALTAASLADAGTGSHDAATFGDPKISTTSVMGGFGFSCADLDGNDYLSIPHTALIDGATDFSIDFWINFDDLSADISILKMFGSNDDEDLHIKYVQSTTEIWCGQDAHTASDGFTETSVTLFTGAWYHFALTRGIGEAGALNFYINGKLIADDIASAAATLPQTSLIFGSTLNGFIDEIRIIRNQATVFTKKPVKAYTCNE